PGGAGEGGAVHARRRLDGVHLLDVVRKDDAGDRALRLRDADRAVHERAGLGRRRADLDVLGRDILEQVGKVDLLLEVAAERDGGGLPHDRHHRLVVHLRVIEAVQEVDRARPRRRYAHTDLAGELRVRARHERGHLLVPDLDVFHPVAGAIQRAEEAVDAVAGVAEDPADPPVAEALNDEVADGAGHEGTLRWRAEAGAGRASGAGSPPAVPWGRVQLPYRVTVPVSLSAAGFR